MYQDNEEHTTLEDEEDLEGSLLPSTPRRTRSLSEIYETCNFTMVEW